MFRSFIIWRHDAKYIENDQWYMSYTEDTSQTKWDLWNDKMQPMNEQTYKQT